MLECPACHSELEYNAWPGEEYVYEIYCTNTLCKYHEDSDISVDDYPELWEQVNQEHINDLVTMYESQADELREQGISPI